MNNETFETLHLQQRKIVTPLFANAKQAFTAIAQPQKYSAKYIVIESVCSMPQKIFMQNNICPVFIHRGRSYIFQEGDNLDLYFLSKKETDKVLCQEQIWRLIQQMTKALQLLRESGYQHRHIKQYAIRRTTSNTFKLIFHPSMTNFRTLIQKGTKSRYDFYLAPQQFLDFSREESTTCVFSLGCLILNIMNPLDFQRKIYSQRDYQINQKILEQKLCNAGRVYSTKIMQIIRLMLIQSHEKRVSLQKLINLISQSNPFDQKLHMTNSVKSIVNSRLSKSRERRTNSPKTNNNEKTMNQSKNDKYMNKIITFQRGTFGGNDCESNSSYNDDEYQNIQQKTALTKQTGINSRLKIQHNSNTNQQNTETKPQRSFSQYLINNKQIDKEDTVTKNNGRTDSQSKGHVKMDISIHRVEQSNNSYNQYMNQNAKTKKIKIQLFKPNSVNPSVIKQQEKQQKYGNPHSSIIYQQNSINGSSSHSNPTIKESIENEEFPRRNNLPDSGVQMISSRVQNLKDRFNKYNLKLSACLQQPLYIAKKLGYQGVWINGNVYYGQFKNGRRNGLALQIFENKEYYFGHYKDDMFHGEGFYFWNSHQHFLGLFQAGAKLEGTWYGRNKYIGEIKDNLRHGIGCYIYANGRIYEGQWFMGKRHGEGIIIEPSGQKFIGMFKMGSKWGKGCYLLEGFRINGIWDGQQPSQSVQIIYEDGRIYNGKINSDFEMDGQGQLKFSTGSSCRGIFDNGNFVFGMMNYRNGERYQGAVKDMRRHGRGTYWYIGGKTITGEWRDNVLIRQE